MVCAARALNTLPTKAIAGCAKLNDEEAESTKARTSADLRYRSSALRLGSGLKQRNYTKHCHFRDV